MLSGIFATPTLRNCPGPPSGTPLGGRRQPSESLAGLRRQGGPVPARRRPRGLLGAVSGQGKAPAGAGAFGSAFEVVQDVRQVRGVVAAELFEEVDLDVHRGSFLSFPFVVPPFYQPPPPVSSPSGVPFATFSSAIRRRRLPSGKTKGPSSQLPARNLPERNLPTCHLTTQ